MTALVALASATLAAPPEGAVPRDLEVRVHEACSGAWRAVEIVLAGEVLRGRLGKTRDTYVRDAVEAVLALFGGVAVRPEALAELRAARRAGMLDGPLAIAAVDPHELRSVFTTVRVEGAVAVGRGAIAAIRRELAAYPALDAALGEHEIGALLVDAARALFRHSARDPELAKWAIGPTGITQRDRALVAFAELAGSPASLDELETLISLPIHLDDNVQFTVYRPRTIEPERWHPMLAFAHLADRRPEDDQAPDPVEEVRRQAEALLGDRAKGYQPVTQDAASAIPAEGELVFVPEIPGIEFNPPRRSFLWLEPVHREEFRLRAGRELHGKTVRGRLTVFLGHIAIAEVALALRVDARPEPATVREPVRARAYRKIFASYSHRDIAIVNQFETYARALGDEYLRDWIHLRTGEVWNDRLRQLIEQSDAFQLFWSWNAMHSKFVRTEYEHALALNRPSFVRPTYWEDPMPTAPGLPPEALLRLHFQKLGAGVIADLTRPSIPAAPVFEDYEPTDPEQRDLAFDTLDREREDRAPEERKERREEAKRDEPLPKRKRSGHAAPAESSEPAPGPPPAAESSSYLEAEPYPAASSRRPAGLSPPSAPASYRPLSESSSDPPAASRRPSPGMASPPASPAPRSSGPVGPSSRSQGPSRITAAPMVPIPAIRMPAAPAPIASSATDSASDDDPADTIPRMPALAKSLGDDPDEARTDTFPAVERATTPSLPVAPAAIESPASPFARPPAEYAPSPAAPVQPTPPAPTAPLEPPAISPFARPPATQPMQPRPAAGHAPRVEPPAPVMAQPYTPIPITPLAAPPPPPAIPDTPVTAPPAMPIPSTPYASPPPMPIASEAPPTRPSAMALQKTMMANAGRPPEPPAPGPVSPFGPTVPQQMYKPDQDPFGAVNPYVPGPGLVGEKQAPPVASSRPWAIIAIIVAIIAIGVVIAAFLSR